MLERQNQMYRFCSNIKKKQEKRKERMMSKDNDIVITFKTNLYFIADHDRKPTKKWCEQELSMPNKERGMTVSIFIQTVLISLR